MGHDENFYYIIVVIIKDLMDHILQLSLSCYKLSHDGLIFKILSFFCIIYEAVSIELCNKNLIFDFNAFFLFGILDLSFHDGEELWEIYSSSSIRIDLMNHILQLSFSCSKISHDGLMFNDVYIFFYIIYEGESI